MLLSKVVWKWCITTATDDQDSRCTVLTVLQWSLTRIGPFYKTQCSNIPPNLLTDLFIWMVSSGDFLSKKTTFTIPLCNRLISQLTVVSEVLRRSRETERFAVDDTWVRAGCEATWELWDSRAPAVASAFQMQISSPHANTPGGRLLCGFCNAFKPGTSGHPSFVGKEIERQTGTWFPDAVYASDGIPPFCCHCFNTTRWWGSSRKPPNI